MSNECKCTHPDGGGAKCPVQHVALCIRGKDMQCYGECVPIPGSYSFETSGFNRWLDDIINQSVNDYARANYGEKTSQFGVTRLSDSSALQDGRITFQLDTIKIHIRFSYEFRNNIEPLGGLQEEAYVS
ncbi:hypothetical protein [Chitinophaga sp. RAB17]|uniref:hypothetical protein n=1 Tax=Chitinophaga sp. RAB17 TaxID=3233049 RepID=UPI003F901A97